MAISSQTLYGVHQRYYSALAIPAFETAPTCVLPRSYETYLLYQGNVKDRNLAVFCSTELASRRGRWLFSACVFSVRSYIPFYFSSFALTVCCSNKRSKAEPSCRVALGTDRKS